jgi:hypothetical protein
MTPQQVERLLKNFGVVAPQADRRSCTATSGKVAGHPRASLLNCTGRARLKRFTLGFIVIAADSRSPKMTAANGTRVTLFAIPGG